MKRSEMLELIQDHIENIISCDRWYIQEHIERYTDCLLKDLEEQGMAPPFYDKEQNNNGDKTIVPCRSWEPEDGENNTHTNNFV